MIYFQSLIAQIVEQFFNPLKPNGKKIMMMFGERGLGLIH